MNIFKTQNIAGLFLFIIALGFAAVPPSNAQMFAGHMAQDLNFEDPRVISGVVVEIRPDTVLLENDEHVFTVSTDDLSVEDMDVQFLQIGDEMSVSGHVISGAFDAQNILYVDF